jgi:hypothetical protein
LVADVFALPPAAGFPLPVAGDVGAVVSDLFSGPGFVFRFFSGPSFVFVFAAPPDGLFGTVAGDNVVDLLSGVSFAFGLVFDNSFGLAFGKSWPAGRPLGVRLVEVAPPF